MNAQQARRVFDRLVGYLSVLFFGKKIVMVFLPAGFNL